MSHDYKLINKLKKEKQRNEKKNIKITMHRHISLLTDLH